MSRFLHVANGSSTTRTIAEAGIPGLLSIWADPLHDGPVPGDLSDEALLEVRARFLGAPAEEVRATIPVEGPRGCGDRSSSAHDAYDELVLWFEHDLFDQLNLIQLLSWITSPASLVEGCEPGVHRVVSRSS